MISCKDHHCPAIQEATGRRFLEKITTAAKKRSDIAAAEARNHHFLANQEATHGRLDEKVTTAAKKRSNIVAAREEDHPCPHKKRVTY
jgi:hypothetical protein